MTDFSRVLSFLNAIDLGVDGHLVAQICMFNDISMGSALKTELIDELPERLWTVHGRN